MFSKYEGKLEQKEEKAIEKETNFPAFLTALKQYVFRVKARPKEGGTTWSNI